MRICVFVRPVQHPALPVFPSPGVSRTEDLPGYHPVPNPCDESSLEAALSLKDPHPEAIVVTACSVGGAAAARVLREFLACGAEHAFCLEQPQWEPDASVTARLLAAFFQQEPFDLGLFGSRDTDTGWGAVGPLFSEMAGIPYVDRVVRLSREGETSVEVERRMGRFTERLRLALPAALGILRGEPLRYPSFWDRQRAFKARISIRPAPLEAAARLTRLRFTSPKPRKRSVAEAAAGASGAERLRQAFGLSSREGKTDASTLLRGDPGEVACAIVRILRQERILDLGED